MPTIARELTPLQVRRLLTQPGTHAVGGVAGLYLDVESSGAASWILRAMVGGDRRHFGLGSFGDAPLADARARARVLREEIRQGIDPAAKRKAALEALRVAQLKRKTFAEVARLCHASKTFKNVKHRAQWIATLEAYAFPFMGDVDVDAVEHAHILAALTPIWTTKTETASRVRGRIESVLDYAMADVNKYRAKGDNPARWSKNLEHALPKARDVATVEHHAAVAWQEAGAFLSVLRSRDALSARALELVMLTAARSGEVRLAEWREFDLVKKVWTVPAARMKTGKVHRVPLCDAAVRLLESLPRTAGQPLVFAGPKGTAPSDSTLSKFMRELGDYGVPHGLRSAFKDWARNLTAYADEVSELALAHVNDDATRAAYARDELIEPRRRLMADWCRYLEAPALPVGGEVVPLRGRA